MNLYRDITTMPVFAKAGAIIPLQEDYMDNADENPHTMHLYVYAGKDGSFTLYEDDNHTNAYQEGKCVTTFYSWQDKDGCLQIHGAQGEISLIPKNRDYTITFYGISDAEIQIEMMDDAGREITKRKDKNGMLEVVIEDISSVNGAVLSLKEIKYTDNEVTDRCFHIIDRAEIEIMTKENVFHVIETQTDAVQLLGSLAALELDRDLYGALVEIITA